MQIKINNNESITQIVLGKIHGRKEIGKTKTETY